MYKDKQHLCFVIAGKTDEEGAKKRLIKKIPGKHQRGVCLCVCRGGMLEGVGRER